jgi:hypothetical protein
MIFRGPGYLGLPLPSASFVSLSQSFCVPPPFTGDTEQITGKSSLPQIISDWLCVYQLLEAAVQGDVWVGVYYVFFLLAFN